VSRAPLRFWKYEGTANDFVLVESDDPFADLDRAWVVDVCDRHRGVGADGVLLVTPADHVGHDARMIVRNADGSRPEMCGNGLRCVALHVAWRRSASSVRAPIELTIETDAGRRLARVDSDDVDVRGEVTVDMGRVVVGPTRTIEVAGERFEETAASVGNPHAVTFSPLDDRALDVVGAALQGSPQFPHGVNFERVSELGRDGDGHLGARVDVFERGVGRTLACGTGACAVAGVIVAKGLAKAGESMKLRLAGGPLAIAVDDAGAATMRGPARRVFAGELAASGVVGGAAR
jgi:diaminopimelate epimerase